MYYHIFINICIYKKCMQPSEKGNTENGCKGFVTFNLYPPIPSFIVKISSVEPNMTSCFSLTLFNSSPIVTSILLLMI